MHAQQANNNDARASNFPPEALFLHTRSESSLNHHKHLQSAVFFKKYASFSWKSSSGDMRLGNRESASVFLGPTPIFQMAGP